MKTRMCRMLLLYVIFGISVSCIKNDLPYPIVELKFLSIGAEGEESAAMIDDANRNVVLNLGEEVNLSNVNILAYTVTEGAQLSTDITGGIDLTTPYGVVLSLYQDYFWTISVVHIATTPVSNRHCCTTCFITSIVWS